MHQLTRSGTLAAAEVFTGDTFKFVAKARWINGQLVLNLFVDLGAGAVVRCHLRVSMRRVLAHVVRHSVDSEQDEEGRREREGVTRRPGHAVRQRSDQSHAPGSPPIRYTPHTKTASCPPQFYSRTALSENTAGTCASGCSGPQSDFLRTAIEC